MALLERERLGSGPQAVRMSDCNLAKLAQAQPGATLHIEPDLPF